jgi:hypothetical protein
MGNDDLMGRVTASFGKSIGALSCAVALVACGGSSNGVSGTVAGKSLTPLDAIVVAGAAASTKASAVVFMSSQTNECTDFGAGTQRRGELGLQLELSKRDSLGNPVPLTIGTYAIVPEAQLTMTPSTSQASAIFIEHDAMCKASRDEATSGSVTLTTGGALMKGTAFSGSFDVKFSDGEFSGSFNALDCDVSAGTASLCADAAPTDAGTASK